MNNTPVARPLTTANAARSHHHGASAIIENVVQ